MPATQPPQSRRASAGVARGILIHRILQNLPDLPESRRAAYIEASVGRAGAEASLVGELMALTTHPVLVDILSAEGHSEAALITQTADGRAERRRIDRLIDTADGILVADYKTDRIVPERVEDCNPEYLMQLAIYRYALKLARPGKAMRFCLVWTEAPRLMTVPDDVLDRMAALRRAQP
jgi:ATP-dependent helicase/nuclease subunit A